ncbi:MAG: helix-turn-helix domain-containing protein [Butyricicoccaceae bacterium]
MTIGERIKQRREYLKMSQEELAHKLGYKSRSSINKIELGANNLTQSKIKAIADALETTPSYIMGWEDDTSLEPVVEHISQSMDAIRKAQRIAAALAGAESFDTAVLTHPNVVRLLDTAQDATQDELLDAVSYLEYQKSKRSILHTNVD